MTDIRRLTLEEIDEGWRLDIEEREPSSGFEEAFWEQHDRRHLMRRFGDGAASFGARSAS